MQALCGWGLESSIKNKISEGVTAYETTGLDEVRTILGARELRCGILQSKSSDLDKFQHDVMK